MQLTDADRAVLKAADEWLHHMDLADGSEYAADHSMCADIALAHLEDAVRARRLNEQEHR